MKNESRNPLLFYTLFGKRGPLQLKQSPPHAHQSALSAAVGILNDKAKSTRLKQLPQILASSARRSRSHVDEPKRDLDYVSREPEWQPAEPAARIPDMGLTSAWDALGSQLELKPL